MVEYADVTRFASQAFVEALMKSEAEAKQAATNAAEQLGLGEDMATQVAEQVSRWHMTRVQRSTEPA